ncbi:Cas9 inhibitor AcrIIA9 family protein [Clostridium perfringens]|uniref:Cas9 inhibitor AcrIIA9 family protein n=1 Tax=Clostridium perfringens TaxID=1502 RepID=UPI001ABBBF3C|nr:hypothetical protein [Clostridium perfringens]
MKEAIDKIKSIKDDVRVPSDPIKKWLVSKCRENNDFCSLVNKTNTDNLFGYVYEEVRKKLNGKNGWVDDDVVYKMAESYFGKASISKKEKKEEIKKESNVIDFKAKKENTSKVKTKKNKADRIIDNQISIFDL